ncbi:MAG: hypothetical protein QQN65_03270 [Nitrosopumilus sp.]
MTTINVDHRVNNILTTVDTTIVVTVKRLDTEQDFISAAMTEDTIGKYSYEFTDPDNDLKYEYTINITHDSKNTTIEGNRYGIVTKAYANRDQAQTYFNEHLHIEPWDDATESEQVKVGIEATRRIDRLAISGVKNKEAQLLKFPRGDGIVPTAILEAQFEISLAILDEVEDEDRSVSSRSFGGIRTTYDLSVPQPWLSAGILSKEAWFLLLPYLSKAREIKLYRES